MKAKKLLAVLLVAVMLIVPVSCFAGAASASIASGPIKTAYTDCEFFNPQGIVIEYNGTFVEYTPDNAKFAFMPGLNEHLTTEVEVSEGVYTTDVDVYYDNIYAGTVTVNVSHVWGDLTYIDNNFHGAYCLGCGKVKETVAHTVDEFIPNDDGGLFIQQTQTGVCTGCHAEVTESINGSEKFISIFDFSNMTQTEGMIVGYIYSILVTLIQTLVGIQ